MSINDTAHEAVSPGNGKERVKLFHQVCSINYVAVLAGTTAIPAHVALLYLAQGDTQTVNDMHHSQSVQEYIHLGINLIKNTQFRNKPSQDNNIVVLLNQTSAFCIQALIL